MSWLLLKSDLCTLDKDYQVLVETVSEGMPFWWELHRHRVYTLQPSHPPGEGSKCCHQRYDTQHPRGGSYYSLILSCQVEVVEAIKPALKASRHFIWFNSIYSIFTSVRHTCTSLPVWKVVLFRESTLCLPLSSYFLNNLAFYLYNMQTLLWAYSSC